jgi:hypothetical protein
MEKSRFDEKLESIKKMFSTSCSWFCLHHPQPVEEDQQPQIAAAAAANTYVPRWRMWGGECHVTIFKIRSEIYY